MGCFTAEPGAADTRTLTVPGAQVTLLRGARVRLQVDAVVRLSCPAVEIDLREGQTVRVDPANTARFEFDREVQRFRWREHNRRHFYRRLPATSGAPCG